MLARHILRDGYRAASSWPFVGSEVLRGAWRAARHSGRPPPGSGNGKQQAAAASTPGARTPQQPAQGAAWLEPALKVLLPPLAILMELWLGHEAYHELICPPGTERAGALLPAVPAGTSAGRARSAQGRHTARAAPACCLQGI
jgi:hypothetical protein